MDEVEQLRAEVAALREQVAAPSRTTRRGMLRLAGAAAAGGAAAALAGGRRADAASTTLMTEVNNNTGATTAVTSSASTAFAAHNLTTTGQGLYGTAKVNGTAVHGLIDNTADTLAYGVWGEIETAKGYALVGTGGAAQLLLEPNFTAGLPVSHGVLSGSLRANFTGLYYCLASDAGSGDLWRVVVDAASAGAYHPITPARVYDSRRALPGLTLANSSVGKLNGSRQITVVCGGTATSCHFIVDVVGYYL